MKTPVVNITLAILCQNSEFNKHRHGAIVLNRSHEAISHGWNKRKTHPKQKKAAIKAGEPAKEFLHAEIDALIKVDNPYAYAIVVGRLNKRGMFTYSKPCHVCMRAIKEAGIRWLFYTGYQGELIKEKVV